MISVEHTGDPKSADPTDPTFLGEFQQFGPEPHPLRARRLEEGIEPGAYRLPAIDGPDERVPFSISFKIRKNVPNGASIRGDLDGRQQCVQGSSSEIHLFSLDKEISDGLAYLSRLLTTWSSTDDEPTEQTILTPFAIGRSTGS